MERCNEKGLASLTVPILSPNMKSTGKHRKLVEPQGLHWGPKNKLAYVRLACLAKHKHYKTSHLITRSVKNMSRKKCGILGRAPYCNVWEALCFVSACLLLKLIFFSLVLLICQSVCIFITIIFLCTIFCVWRSLRSTEVFYSSGFIVFRCTAVDPRGAPCRCESVYVCIRVRDFERSLSRVCVCVSSPPASRARRCAEVIIKGCCAKWRLKLKAAHWDASDYAGKSPWGWPDGGTRLLFAPKLTAWLRRSSVILIWI